MLWCLSLTGILYKGNGENVFISQQPPVLSSIMGKTQRLLQNLSLKILDQHLLNDKNNS